MVIIYLFKILKHVRVPMPSKKLSNKNFETFLHSLFSNDKMKLKYQNPDAWRTQPSKKQ